MGIRGLTSQIQPYGQPITWHKGSNEEPSHDVIIDGPSFAYYIHHKCLATKTHARNALEAMPTYPELGEAAVAWLENLETFGLRVKHIYFDGYLPVSKTSTRHERLEKNLIQLRAFRSAYTNIAWGGSTSTIRRPAGTAGTKHIPSRLSALPATPFLIPVIVDALDNSRYGSVTQTVPCEAEVACVNDREPSDIIFTNDSDLIILTPVGKVMFFNDLLFGTINSNDDILDGVYYSRLDIASSLNCGDLLKLAFYMTRDPSCGIKECAKQASQRGFPSDNVAQKYAMFKEAYATAAQYSTFGSVTDVKQPYPRLQARLEQIDARVSELMQQWLSGLNTPEFPIAGAAGDYMPPHDTRQMFLSFLIDDPTRASAWRASGEIRQLAYSILALYGPKWKMTEYDRRGERMVAIEVAITRQPQAVTTACQELLGSLPSAISRGQTGDISLNRWKLCLLVSVLRSIASSTAAMPLRDSIGHFLSLSSSSYSWPHIHLSAQLEGYLYSLRILQQILSVYLCGEIPTHPQIDVDVFRKLYESLESLPAIHNIFDRAGGGFQLGDEAMTELDVVLNELYGTTANGDADEQGTDDGFETQKKRKKRRKAESTSTTSSMPVMAAAPKNMFDLLDEG